VVISPKAYPNWKAFNQANVDAVNEIQPDLILLAGYLSLFIPDESYTGKIMNTHPALIPAFCGKGMYGHRVHQAVIESGVKVSGATIHFVDNEYDSGPIILQKSVPVDFEDTPESLAEKVQAVEREIYPQAILLFAENRLKVIGRRVQILPKHED
jgi:phosphoribosylglycinamide formyltransferase-1